MEQIIITHTTKELLDQISDLHNENSQSLWLTYDDIVTNLAKTYLITLKFFSTDTKSLDKLKHL